MATYVTQDLAWIDRAPLVVQATEIVAGSPAEVWAVVADHASWPTWFSNIARARATSEPPSGVGSTRDVTLKGGGGTVSERFIAWDEPSVWAFTATAGPPVFTSIVERITIEPVDDARTSVTYCMALAPRGVLRPLLSLAKGRLAKVLADALRGLAGEVATRRGTSS